jgi:hypothetical protein
MSKSSPEAPLNTSDENNFSPKSFVIFCLDEQGNVAFEASWGETQEDIKKFAALMNKINKGTFENMILEQLKIQAKENSQPKELAMFNKAYKDLKKPKNLVVDPTNVELL